MRETESSVWREKKGLRRAAPSSPARELFRKAEWLSERRDMPERRRLAAPETVGPAVSAAAAGEHPGMGILDSVKSPTVGVFYAAPAENADPFVKVGDVVHKGSVLCIIEAMKLMNEVLAEKDGVIEEICAQNGQLVEYGTELFRIKELSA